MGSFFLTPSLKGKITMILILKNSTTKEEMEKLKDILRSEGYLVKEIGGVDEKILGIVGKSKREVHITNRCREWRRPFPYPSPTSW